DTTFTVNVYQNPTVAINPIDNGCQENLTLRADPTPTGTYSYVWSNNGNPVPNSSMPMVNFTTIGDYSIEVLVSDQQTGCTASAGPQDFTVYESIIVNIISSQACDDGNPVLLTAEANLSGLTYNWFSREGLPITSEDTDTTSVMQEGEYGVNASNSAGCVGSDTTIVNRLPTTEADLPSRYLYCAEDPNPDNTFVIIEPGNTFISYEWFNLESNNLMGTDPSLIVSGGEEGNIEARLTNAFGCVTLDTVAVENDCEPRVFIPTAFTPNGDGFNDSFSVQPLFVTDFEVFIFSRWGELIFYSNEPDFTWDGTFNGKVLPTGTYAYKITFKSETRPERGTIERRGGVTLIR
ncbi:MAG: gliding motility-associated C-terminal domain-containing protein, partial [Cyclobacteriaceae bacterium]